MFRNESLLAPHLEALEGRLLLSGGPPLPAPDGQDMNGIWSSLIADSVRNQSQAAQAGGFKVYDALVTLHKPDMQATWGLSNLYLRGRWFPRDMTFEQTANSEPDEATIRSVAHSIPAGGILVVDIECWNTCTLDDAEFAKNLARYMKVADIIRDENPNIKFGFFGLIPNDPVYYSSTATRPTNPINALWMRRNDALKALAAKVDIIVPDLYQMFSDITRYVEVDSAILDQARTYGKPVLPFISPQFIGNIIGDESLLWQPVPASDWQTVLNLVRQKADGAVIWGGMTLTGNWEWDANAPWAKATREFLLGNGIYPTLATGSTALPALPAQGEIAPALADAALWAVGTAEQASGQRGLQLEPPGASPHGALGEVRLGDGVLRRQAGPAGPATAVWARGARTETGTTGDTAVRYGLAGAPLGLDPLLWDVLARAKLR